MARGDGLLKNGNDATKFSKENQPSPEAKSKGRIKKYLLKDIANQLVSGDSKTAIKELAEYLEIDVKKIDIETAMHLKQIEKAVKKGDTQAYNSVMDRLNGKPKQAIDHTTGGDKIQRAVLSIDPLNDTSDNSTK